MNTNTLAANEANFQEIVLGSDKPVLVDFWAAWCGPCKALSPIVDEIATTRADSLKVVKVDVDANPGLAVRYDIRALPTLVVFRGGQPVNRIVGLSPKQQILAQIGAAA